MRAFCVFLTEIMYESRVDAFFVLIMGSGGFECNGAARSYFQTLLSSCPESAGTRWSASHSWNY